MKLLIAGGGTGGHVFPAIAVAQEWQRRAPLPPGKGEARSAVLVGTERGIETRLVPEAGLPLELVRVAGLKGIGGVKLLRNTAKLPLALSDALAIVKRHAPAAAFGVGGYASGPVIFAAAMSGVPTVIFEPNAEPGFANRLLAPLARRIAVAHPSTAQRWGAKAVVTGCPVRGEFFAIPERKPAAGQPFTVLITGGSQGALPINRAMIDALDLLAARKGELFFLHQSGERDYNAVRVAYARREFNAEVVPFIAHMAEAFARADLILCRAGAITVAEIAAAGRAAVFIPFAAATDSHQLRNAQAFAAAGAARLIPQPELTPQRIRDEVFSLLDAPAACASLAANARALARPRAVADIVDLIEREARA